MTRERDERSVQASFGKGGPDAGCARVRGRLEELHDGGLDAVAEARDLGHLEVCASCQAQSAAYLELVGSVAEALTAPGLDEAVTSSLAGFDAHLSGRGVGQRLVSAARRGAADSGVAGTLGRRRPALLAAAAAIFLAFVLDQAGLPAAWSAVSSLEEVPAMPRVGELPSWDAFLGTDPEAAR